MQSDDLLERCIRLDSAAWTVLVDSHRHLVLRVLTRILGTIDPDSIQDLEQESFERLLQRDCEALRSVQNAKHLKGLLCTTAANLARDHLRRMGIRRQWVSPERETEDGEERSQRMGPILHVGAEERLHRNRRLERTFQALAKIVKEPHAARDILIFQAHYLDDLTAPEIASMGLGLSTKGVETVLYRLTKKIREWVKAEEEPAA